MRLIKVDMTEAQIEILKPLFKAAETAYNNGNQGSILCRAYENIDAEKPFYFKCGFVPNDPAKKIIKILNEYDAAEPGG